jgi:competence protein ComEC
MQSWMIGAVSGAIFTGTWRDLPPWPLSLLLVGFALVTLRLKSVGARLFCGLACGSALGIVYGTVLLQHRLDVECVGVSVTVTGTVSSLPSDRRGAGGERRQRFEFTVDGLEPTRCAGPAKLMLSYYGKRKIHPGEQWQFDVKLRKPWGLANPGSFNMQVWFAQEAIDAVGSVRESGLTKLLSSAGGVSAIHHRLRQQISERIGELELDRDVTAMLQAMTVADNSAIDPPLWQLGQQLGINHLLVISGSHIIFVAGAGFLLGGIFTRITPWSGFSGVWVPQVFALVLACLYGGLAGFAIPVQRALCMLGCFVVASLTARRSEPLHSLLLAATAVLIVNPLAALGSGFWLSFGAVLALLWLARWQQAVSTVTRLFSTHGFMSLVMLPLGALFFGGGSVVAMVANLLMIPLVGLVVVPLSLLAVVGFLGGWPAASELWYLAGWPLQQLLPAAYMLADLGDEWLFLPLSANLSHALLAVLAAGLLILPGTVRLKLLALVLALPLFLPPVLNSPVPDLNTRVTVLDVGQGTAVVVRSGDRALVYDTGGGDPKGLNMASMAVLPYLQQQGITSLNTLVISHPDLDHSAGTAVILDTMAVERFRFGGVGPGVGEGRPCVAGEAWRWPGGQVFQFLSPALETPYSSNDSSCVLQVQVGDYRLLLPGDIEEDRERTLVRYWGEDLDSDWLLAAHHGSRTSSSLALLKRVRPKAAVISSGYANRFGHPHPLVIRRLHDRGVKVFSTASGGALEFELVRGQALRIEAFRQIERRYWM